MAEKQDEQTTREVPSADNGHLDLRDIVEILLGYDDDTFIEQLVSIVTSPDPRWNTQQGPRVLRRPGILQRVARIMQEDYELYEGVFLPGMRLDRRFNLAKLERELQQLLPRAPTTFPVPQSGAVLMAKHYDPTEYIVEDLLHEGLTILAGKPKKGKSYLALDMSLAIAVGRLAFRHFPTKQQRVLYISLEDGERRLQNRLRKIQPNLTHPGGLDFLYSFPKLGAGALEALEHYAETYGCIIVDVIGRILPEVQTVHKSTNEYQLFTDLFGQLQTFANARHIVLLLIDHVRKASSDDVYDTIMGSQGKWGTADIGLVYERKGQEKEALLHVAGREVEEQTFIISLVDGHLEYLGSGELYELDAEQNKIIRILAEERRPMGIPELMKAMGIQAEGHYMRFRQVMSRLYNEDRIGRTKRGLYRVYSDERCEDLPF